LATLNLDSFDQRSVPQPLHVGIRFRVAASGFADIGERSFQQRLVGAIRRLCLGELRSAAIDLCRDAGLFALELVEREGVREVCLEQLFPFELCARQSALCHYELFCAEADFLR
jgi:hypothetical protein